MKTLEIGFVKQFKIFIFNKKIYLHKFFKYYII